MACMEAISTHSSKLCEVMKSCGNVAGPRQSQKKQQALQRLEMGKMPENNFNKLQIYNQLFLLNKLFRSIRRYEV